MCTIGKCIETECRIEVTKDWGEGALGSYCLVGTGFLLGMIKKIWKWIVVMVTQHFECT